MQGYPASTACARLSEATRDTYLAQGTTRGRTTSCQKCPQGDTTVRASTRRSREDRNTYKNSGIPTARIEVPAKGNTTLYPDFNAWPLSFAPGTLPRARKLLTRMLEMDSPALGRATTPAEKCSSGQAHEGRQSGDHSVGQPTTLGVHALNLLHGSEGGRGDMYAETARFLVHRQCLHLHSTSGERRLTSYVLPLTYVTKEIP